MFYVYTQSRTAQIEHSCGSSFFFRPLTHSTPHLFPFFVLQHVFHLPLRLLIDFCWSSAISQNFGYSPLSSSISLPSFPEHRCSALPFHAETEPVRRRGRRMRGGGIDGKPRSENKTKWNKMFCTAGRSNCQEIRWNYPITFMNYA